MKRRSVVADRIGSGAFPLAPSRRSVRCNSQNVCRMSHGGNPTRRLSHLPPGSDERIRSQIPRFVSGIGVGSSPSWRSSSSLSWSSSRGASCSLSPPANTISAMLPWSATGSPVCAGSIVGSDGGRSAGWTWFQAAGGRFGHGSKAPWSRTRSVHPQAACPISGCRRDRDAPARARCHSRASGIVATRAQRLNRGDLAIDRRSPVPACTRIA